MIRITAVEPIGDSKVKLTLTDGSVVERDLSRFLSNPLFASLAADPDLFRRVSVEGGTLVWSNGLDLCPDMIIWGGPPPLNEQARAS